VCGICGWAGGAAQAGEEGIVRAMATALAHRGPDSEGALELGVDGGVGWFGHRRLRVIDLSAAADQPMTSPDGRLALTFNGEIYNFRELRRWLAQDGWRFRSSGDTEVVLAACARWGAAAVQRLDGMFAFALWDARRRALLLARDRTGKKPLFYVLGGGRLTFASEVKALARAPWLRLEPDLGQLPALLAFGCCSAPATPYRGVRQLPPGHLAQFDVCAGRLTVSRYWTALPHTAPRTAGADVVRSLRSDVETATRRRLVSDKPLGALLSGGIDSSIVVALMARHASEPVRTFSAGFPDEPTYDERAHARDVARHLGTEHTEFAVQADTIGLLDRLIWLHDGPFGDSSAIPTYLVCAAAREHVTVVLTGDGGDEVFAGYQRFAAAALARLLPSPLQAPARAAARRLPAGPGYHDPVVRLRRFLAVADGPLEQRYLGWLEIFDRDLLSATLGRERAAEEAEAPFMSCVTAADDLPALDRILYANLATYLPDDLLVKLDRMSMAHSLEARSPLLDTAVIERLARVRARDKIGLRTVKPLLRRAFGPLLPEAIWRRPKHGFGVPVDRWFDGPLGDVYGDEVLGHGGRLQTMLDPAVLRRLHTAHRAGTDRHGARMWTLLTVERWLRDCARDEPLREPSAAVVSAESR
jgi:asparagine synthase (glutamine-hydrolysing)